MRRLYTILMLCLVACPLAACGGTIVSQPPDLRIADAALTKPAADPVRLPDRKLSQAEVERYWGTDALNLRVCKADKASLAGFYRDQIIALRKGPAAK